MSKRSKGLREVLERLYERYNRRELVPPDPLLFVYKYDRAADMEIVGLLSAVLAYGRVAQIGKSMERLLGVMGKSPHEYVMGFGKRGRAEISGFKHRFTTGEDIGDLLGLLKTVIRKFGSIEGFFLDGYDDSDENILAGLARFCDGLGEMYAAEHGGRESGGLKYLLASPTRGSACKRMNLYLRWMVRDDDVDSGLWKGVDKAKLVVPVDVHMGRLCKILGLYEQKTVTMRAAVDITQSFAAIEPSDPVKYDFCLSRIGIVENCDGRIGKRCEVCELFGYCKKKV